jgi:hypothetical protein
MACGLNFTSQPIIKEGKDSSATLNGSVHIKGMYDEVIHHVKLSRNLLATCGDQMNSQRPYWTHVTAIPYQA